MNNSQIGVEKLVLIQLQNSSFEITEELLKKLIDSFSIINPLSENEKDEVLKSLQTKLTIKMDRGAFIKGANHSSWYFNAKKDLDDKYWQRYSMYLLSDLGFSTDVINTLDKTTDELMDLLGNPNQDFSFKRNGLIIGDVQSGKTSTYTGLINKAADSGYKIIILLTGTIEKLRKQTQARIDEGFIGLDSTAFNQNKDDVLVGVGNYDSSISSWAVTSTSDDFNTATARKLNGKLSSIKDPVIFVIKKNKSVLEKLEKWLRVYNANTSSGQIDIPLLLIDDEADNASVNTNDVETNPTVINANIRKLRNLFTKSNYVGFTATPFANIFIDPETEEEMLKADLFPSDFIYALEAPTNYIGARDIFSENAKYAYMLKENDDCQFEIPITHKKEFKPNNLPRSLIVAIESFFIANAIRDLRGDTTSHRSMLINVSRFVDVQNVLTISVEDYVRDLQRKIKNYSKVKSIENSENFLSIHETFKLHFKCEYKWEEVLSTLFESTSGIIIRTINGKNASGTLNYEDFVDGLRLIAIGGYSLSRGLTLEGLIISYFYRNSKMYDTLMQMGRWFGYRDKYKDLCQIWMPEKAIDWYAYISLASDELRREVRKMQAANKTPRDFGLCVRSDITTMLVTAHNKMRTATNYSMVVSLNGKVIETPFLHNDEKIISYNRKVTSDLISNLFRNNFKISDSSNLAIKNQQINFVPKKIIVDYLSKFNTHQSNVELRSEDIVKFIEQNTDSSLDYWDIVVASGTGTSTVNIGGISVSPVQRKFDIKYLTKGIQLSGSKSRLGSTTYAKAGLTLEQTRKIESEELNLQKIEGHSKNFSQDMYFDVGIDRNPLLIIYPVELKTKIKNYDLIEVVDDERQEVFNRIGTPMIGLGIGIPKVSNDTNRKIVYKINKVKFRELFEIDDDIDPYEEEDGLDESIN